jgi:hypothetical protein
MRRALALLLAVLLSVGCATGGAGLSVHGRQVTALEADDTARRRSPQEEKRVEGELIAAEPARLWLLGKEQVFDVPLSSVAEVRVQRHTFTARKAFLWTLAGAVVTGGLLTGACSAVEGTQSCGNVFLVTSAIWLGVGGLAAKSMEGSSAVRFRRPSAEDLSPYARFPQGVPEGFDPHSLQPSPSPNR